MERLFCRNVGAAESAEFASWLTSAGALELPPGERLGLAEILYTTWGRSDPVTAWQSLETLTTQEKKPWLARLKGAVITAAVGKAPQSLLALAPFLESDKDNPIDIRFADRPSVELLSTLQALPPGQVRAACLTSLFEVWRNRAGSDPEQQRMLAFWRGLNAVDKKALDLNHLTPVLHLLTPEEFHAVHAKTGYAQFELQYWLSKRLGVTAPAEWGRYKQLFSAQLFNEAVATAVGDAVEKDRWDTAMALAQQLGSNEAQRTKVLEAVESGWKLGKWWPGCSSRGYRSIGGSQALERIVEAWAEKQTADFLAWSVTAPRDWWTEEFLTTASATLGLQDAGRWWQWQQTVADHPEAAAAMTESLRDIARENGPQAVVLVERLPAETQANVFPKVMEVWQSYDSTGLRTWLATQPVSRRTAVEALLNPSEES